MTLTINSFWQINFVLDIFFTSWFFIGFRKKQKYGFRDVLCFLVLLTTLFLYPHNAFGDQLSSFFRIIIRYIILFLATIALNKKPPLVNFFGALYWTAIMVVSHNLFMSTILRYMISETLVNQSINGIIGVGFICIFVRSICYYPFIKLHPFHSFQNPETIQITSAGIITITSIFMRSSQQPGIRQNDLTITNSDIYYLCMQIAILFLLYMLEKTSITNKEKNIYALQAASSKALLEDIKFQKRNNEQIRKLRHDLRNHMISLRQIILEDHKNEALDYLDEFIEMTYTSERHWETGNNLLNGILAYKLARPDSEGVHLYCNLDFSKSRAISDFDLCTIIGNALDNAIEAVLQCPKDKERLIRISGGPKANMQFVRIENTAPKETLKIFNPEQIHTTKPNKADHGFGIANIQSVLENYHGAVNFSTEDNLFTITMLFPLNKEDTR